MRLVNAAIVALALLATLGGYLQEKGRLEKILQMSPAAARDLYEKAQVRRERVMMVVTAVLAAGAVVALVLFSMGTLKGSPNPPAMGSGGQSPPAPGAHKVQRR